ncbi:unnamed protein product [Phaeothamnion confervicola]
MAIKDRIRGRRCGCHLLVGLMFSLVINLVLFIVGLGCTGTGWFRAMRDENVVTSAATTYTIKTRINYGWEEYCFSLSTVPSSGETVTETFCQAIDEDVKGGDNAGYALGSATLAHWASGTGAALVVLSVFMGLYIVVLLMLRCDMRPFGGCRFPYLRVYGWFAFILGFFGLVAMVGWAIATWRRIDAAYKSDDGPAPTFFPFWAFWLVLFATSDLFFAGCSGWKDVDRAIHASDEDYARAHEPVILVVAAGPSAHAHAAAAASSGSTPVRRGSVGGAPQKSSYR